MQKYSLLEDLKWRYAAKKFDASKKVSESDLEKIKKVVRLTATSYGLQLFKVLIVTKQEIKEQLKLASWGQTQITDASHVIILCNYTHMNEGHLNEFAKIKAKAQNIEVEKLNGYVQFIIENLSKLSDDQFAIWTAKQTYIALGNLMNACAELEIDSCPMEGFEAEKYNKILGLKERGLSAALVCPVGYRAEDDASQHAPKVRRAIEDLFETV